MSPINCDIAHKGKTWKKVCLAKTNLYSRNKMKFGHRERWYITILFNAQSVFKPNTCFINDLQFWYDMAIYKYRDSKVNKMILLSFKTYNLGIFFHMLPVNKWNSMLHWVDGKKTNIWRVKNGQQLSLNHSLNIISSLQRRRS